MSLIYLLYNLRPSPYRPLKLPPTRPRNSFRNVAEDVAERQDEVASEAGPGVLPRDSKSPPLRKNPESTVESLHDVRFIRQFRGFGSSW